MGWLKRVFDDDEDGSKGEPSPATKRIAAKNAAKTAKKAPAKKTAAATHGAAHESAEKAPAKKTAAAPRPRASVPHQASKSNETRATKAAVAANVTHAHDQALTLHLLTHIPDHAPRDDDPHYHLFEQAKARLKRQGLWKCMIGDNLCEGDPELHHTFVEFSQINEVDPKRIQQALGLHFEDDEDFQSWVESPGNLEVLCLPGDAPVLLADGAQRPIASIRLGDLVIGHDMRAHPVTTTSVSEFSGLLVSIDGRRMTGNHPVLTSRGWVPAVSVRPGDLACFAAPDGRLVGKGGEFGMLDTDVFGMAGVEAEVLRPIVGTVAVDVVDPFATGQRTTEDLLQDDAVLHDEAPLSGRPVDDPDATGRCRVAQHTAPLARGLLQSDDPALVGTVDVRSVGDAPDLDVRLLPAGTALDPGVSETELLATFGGAFPAAGHVPLGEFRGNTVFVATTDAHLDDHGVPTAFERRWRPVLHVDHLPFEGKVYDIEVAGAGSFVSDHLIVHNCANHHRAHYGIHVIPGPLWEAIRFRKKNTSAAAEFIPAGD